MAILSNINHENSASNRWGRVWKSRSLVRTVLPISRGIESGECGPGCGKSVVQVFMAPSAHQTGLWVVRSCVEVSSESAVGTGRDST